MNGDVDDGFETGEGDEGRSAPSSLAKLLIAVGALSVVAWLVVPWYAERTRARNERAAIGALKTLVTAQALFRESDKERDQIYDYGTLAELGQTFVIDSVLASGTKRGYVFQCTYSAATSEFLWMATASPLEPGRTGSRHFATNHYGVIREHDALPFELDTRTCELSSQVEADGR